MITSRLPGFLKVSNRNMKTVKPSEWAHLYKSSPDYLRYKLHCPVDADQKRMTPLTVHVYMVTNYPFALNSIS